jgi:hypothetical protein
MQDEQNKRAFQNLFNRELDSALKQEDVKNPGSKAFTLTENFIKKFETQKETVTKKDAVDLFEDIIESTGDKLTPKEKKVFIAIATYLKAKQMKGSS